MNDTQVTIYQPNPFSEGLVPTIEIPLAAKRVADILLSLTGGALCGYVIYWITRLIERAGLLGDLGGAVIQPLPYILSGMMSAALVETAVLTKEAALKILGARETYEDFNPTGEASTLDRFRQHSWKVIIRLEKVQQDADVIFSRIFDIRTTKEIRDNTIRDRDLYFMEITRRAFGEQLYETLGTALPQELGVYIVEAAGYTILGGHLFVWWHGVNFLSGMINKIGEVYKKVQAEERAERRQDQREFENKVYCDILAAMYPAEFAKLDALEQGLDPEQMDEEMVVENETAGDVVMQDQEDEDEAKLEKQDFDEMQLEAQVIKTTNFDPTQHTASLAYRHTVFQALPSKAKAPLEAEDVELSDEESESMCLEEADLSDDLVLVS